MSGSARKPETVRTPKASGPCGTVQWGNLFCFGGLITKNPVPNMLVPLAVLLDLHGQKYSIGSDPSSKRNNSLKLPKIFFPSAVPPSTSPPRFHSPRARERWMLIPSASAWQNRIARRTCALRCAVTALFVVSSCWRPGTDELLRVQGSQGQGFRAEGRGLKAHLAALQPEVPRNLKTQEPGI